ncbi:hypothetical protein EK21DRAFT_97661 [Setomelanomma holmii]|uniref:PBP domain-containing protein n=1 Tax=Setomelanomma holmii TaxID=210430 RepID=A0A9P4HFH0_9PLEO|nr:hypothetical protein EK21DRAFT_97661 [Setomelanomma holmii]
MLHHSISRVTLLLVAFNSGINALTNPTQIYNGGFNQSGSTEVQLRIATGGADQSGLVKVLSDTTFTIKNLQSGEVDLGISYIPSAEKVAADAGFVDSKIYYLFRDHFLVVGPPENPAVINGTMDVTTLFTKLFDKSATNLKESLLWLGIGQVSWATPYSTWYHHYIAFPIQALTTAITLKEYTVTDRGALLSLPTNVSNDSLLLPGHLLIGKKAQNVTLARMFAEWASGPLGQSVVTGYKKNGMQLYSGAPGYASIPGL